MRKLLAAIAAATFLIAACGGDDGGGNEGGSPKEILQNAFEQASTGGNTVVISLNSDAASLSAISEGSINEENAAKVLDSSIAFSGTEATDDPAEAEFAMAVNIAGNTDVEVRLVGGVLYLRVDVDSLLDLGGPEAKAAAGPQIDALVQQASSQGLDWVEAGVNGGWLAFSGFTELLEQFSGMAASPSAEQQALVEKFGKDLIENATVTSEGSDDVGEHLVASVEFRELYDSFIGLSEGLGQALPQEGLPSEGEIPEGEVSLDVWVADGRLAQMEVDFLQLAELGEEEIPEGVENFALRIEFSEFEGGVEVPSDATEVDLAQLIQTFSGGGLSESAGGTDPTGADAFCEQLKAQPKSIQKQFAAQCPDL